MGMSFKLASKTFNVPHPILKDYVKKHGKNAQEQVDH